MSVPQIVVNQEGANLINKLLDVTLRGGGLTALTLVREVITVINTPPPQPKPVEKPELDSLEPKSNIIPIKAKKEK